MPARTFACFPSVGAQYTDFEAMLISQDGGGVRGLSTLYILKQLMQKINPDSPPKPCEIFDLIGGTSTGG